MTLKSFATRLATAAVFVFAGFSAAFGQSGVNVLTYHNNYQRWGWNPEETILTPSAFRSTTSTFGVIATVTGLDNKISAQPLIATKINVSCPGNQTVVTCKTGSLGVHDVVYVSTWSNTVYAIDANTGEILLSRNFGVQKIQRIISCPGGMISTPAIDAAAGIMYVLAHVANDNDQAYAMHAIDLGSLTDVLAPYNLTHKNTIATLTDGTTYGFDPRWACQRSALLLLNGKIYAAFTGLEYSTGDPPVDTSGPSRGWLLGWNASDLSALKPLLINQQATSTNSFFLTSIWMSSAGVASDGTNLFFSTGNSDPSGTSYDPVKNAEESVVKVTPTLAVSSVFTPSDYVQMDQNDLDLSSGGVMVLPSVPPLVVAAGKDGRMFLLNGDKLGGYTAGGPDDVLDMHQINGCWCGPSFFSNAEGMHVVSSGGNMLATWKLVPGSAEAKPSLVQDGGATIAAGSQSTGFFTSVSSNGADSAIIWAVGRPINNGTTITLYAFDATHPKGRLPMLGKYDAGRLTPGGRAAIIFPVVANGKVYVTSGSAGVVDSLKSPPEGTLTIFGLVPNATAPAK